MNKEEKIWVSMTEKTIDFIKEENLKLKKEIDRLNEYIQNLEMIDKHHQDTNGKLRLELTRLKGGL